ncbi:MAG: hypothetical protein C5B54_04165 [Acidobacteria bacterium]|nr:MAG: hypothetical protein C5B54_04165 [Acidobacteriota bacterium]
MNTYWVSFATEEKFLGGCYVDVDIDDDDDDGDIGIKIIQATIQHHCNPDPDSSVRMLPVNQQIPDSFKNRLLSKEEAEKAVNSIN